MQKLIAQKVIYNFQPMTKGLFKKKIGFLATTKVKKIVKD